MKRARPFKNQPHEYWMRRACALALRGTGGASPNPYVGCVIVKNGKAVGEGAHRQFGKAHAEIHALKAAGARARGAVLYVNLEPCSHHGKTPPCADAIIRSGVRTVVCAVRDPNPLVSGEGIRKLRAAGIKVACGIFRKQAEELNRSFIKWITRNEPYVFLKSAMSLDGKTVTAAGQSKWITSEKARRYSRRLRGQMDAVLVGAETVRRDNPRLGSRGEGRDPVRIVLTREGGNRGNRLPEDARIFDGKAPVWILHGRPIPEKILRKKRGEWIYIPSKGNRIDVRKILKVLAERNISRLMVEGGGETAAAFAEARAVDEVLFFAAPVLIGGRSAKTPIEGKGFAKIRDALKLTGLNCIKIGEDLLISARVKK